MKSKKDATPTPLRIVCNNPRIYARGKNHYRSATHRNPLFDVAESGVFRWRAATR